MNELVFFLMGAAGCFALMGIIYLGIAEDYEAQVRYWRKEAIELEEKFLTLQETSK